MTICYQSIMDQYHLNKPNNALTFVISVFSFLLLAAPSVLAQETSYDPNNNTTTSTSFNLTFALIFLALIVLFIVTAFLIVFFSCGGPNSATTANPTGRTTIDEIGPQWVIPVVRQLGLDKSVLDTFPIIKFSEIKGLNPGTLECAVCLSEYNDSDTLRILPGCCHVFHPECIDSWLSNHDICPVCRASLTNPNIIFTESQLETGNGGVITEDERHKMSISMKGTNRFTLRLPEHVLRDIEIHRGYKLSASIAGSGYQGTPMSKSGRVWAFIRTFSSKRGQQLGGGSRSIRLGGSLHRNLTLGRNSRIREVAPVRSGSVRARVDDVASSMVPVQSSSLRGQTNAVASGMVLMRSASVGGQTNMVRAEPVRSGSVRVQTHMVISSTEPSARSGSFRGQTDMVASSTEPVLSGSVSGRADMVPIHEFDQV